MSRLHHEYVIPSGVANLRWALNSTIIVVVGVALLAVLCLSKKNVRFGNTLQMVRAHDLVCRTDMRFVYTEPSCVLTKTNRRRPTGKYRHPNLTKKYTDCIVHNA